MRKMRAFLDAELLVATKAGVMLLAFGTDPEEFASMPSVRKMYVKMLNEADITTAATAYHAFLISRSMAGRN